MSGAIDILNPQRPKRVAIVASNPAVSEQTGWPIGFWWSELTHPYWELTEHGYQVDVASPDGGKLEADSWSDPRDGSRYSADDLLSLGFINSPEHLKLVEESKPIAELDVDDYDAVHPEAVLEVDATHSRRFADWYTFGWRVLDEVLASMPPGPRR